MNQQQIQRVLEAILFVADEAVETSDFAVLLEVPAEQIITHLKDIARKYDEAGSGIVLREVGGGWRLATHPDAAEYLQRFVTEQRTPRLSRPALETLAIVAYRQPVSRAQIDEIRGVSTETVLKTLISRGMIWEVDRDPGPGQAILYGTTQAFLERLGLSGLDDLPDLPSMMPDAQAVEKMESGLGPGV